MAGIQWLSQDEKDLIARAITALQRKFNKNTQVIRKQPFTIQLLMECVHLAIEHNLFQAGSEFFTLAFMAYNLLLRGGEVLSLRFSDVH